MDAADEAKARNRQIWGLGDYVVLSERLRAAAEALCDACAVSAGQEVLDVAAGDGNFALACAREGASVVATDLAPGMVERGRARSAEEGYEIEWQEADAEALPFEDDRFDCVGSVFGAMIAPRPRQAASELFRVVRPGGTVGMTAWTRGSFMNEFIEIPRSYLPPPPPELPTSAQWGEEDTVRERFDGLAASLSLERRSLVWEADSAEGIASALSDSAPPLVAARQNLPPERGEAMAREHLELIRRRGGGDGAVRVEAEYLLIVARKRG